MTIHSHRETGSPCDANGIALLYASAATMAKEAKLPATPEVLPQGMSSERQDVTPKSQSFTPAPEALWLEHRGLSTERTTHLRNCLKRLAESAIGRVAEKPVGFDPIIGAHSVVASVAAKVQKVHGKDLPAALGRILEAHGFKVWVEPQVWLPANAVALARDNTIDTLATLKVPACGADRKIYRPDLIVYCGKTGWTCSIEGKRGGGASDSTAKNESTVNIRATYLSLPQWAREQGLQPSICDARIIDFFGASGFSDELALRGWQLDSYFGCLVEEELAWYGAYLRVGADELLARLTSQDFKTLLQPPGDLINETRVRPPVGICEHLATATRRADQHSANCTANDGNSAFLGLQPKDHFSRPDRSYVAAILRQKAAV